MKDQIDTVKLKLYLWVESVNKDLPEQQNNWKSDTSISKPWDQKGENISAKMENAAWRISIITVT